MSEIAIDTNILLYALDDFYPDKQTVSRDIITDNPFFCSQNLSEFANVCLKRWKFPKSRIAELIKIYLHECSYIPVNEVMVLRAIDLMEKYNFQLFDSIIISAALESGCTIFYSEDMHHNLLVDKQLRIINPFI